MTPLQVSLIAGPLVALIAGVLIGIATGIAGGNSKLGVYWGVVFFTYLTIETQQEWFLGLFIVLMIGVSLAVASYILGFFFASADDGGF